VMGVRIWSIPPAAKGAVRAGPPQWDFGLKRRRAAR
jgi:hypothetical protein